MKGSCIISIVVISCLSLAVISVLQVWTLGRDLDACKKSLWSVQTDYAKETELRTEFEERLGICLRDRDYLQEKVCN